MINCLKFWLKRLLKDAPILAAAITKRVDILLTLDRKHFFNQAESYYPIALLLGLIWYNRLNYAKNIQH